LTYNGFAGSTEIFFEISDDDGETWEELDDSTFVDGSGIVNNTNINPHANGNYLIRAKNGDSSVISNIVEYTINCELPLIEIVSADYDCLTDDINVEFTLSSPHANEDIVFKFGLGDPTPWLHTWNELDHATGGGNSTYTAGPIANGTYVVVAVITDVNGTHTSEPFEVIVNCA
jgi:hypothetical protein